eukprot:COSAG02_NODE_34092_length_489_cov_1.751282_1_plen_23_part_10
MIDIQCLVRYVRDPEEFARSTES